MSGPRTTPGALRGDEAAFAYESNSSYAELARRIGRARRIALTTHEKPDGDALGSLLALHRAMRARGQAPDIFVVGPLDAGLSTVAEPTPLRDADRDPPDDDYDLIVLVDTGAWTQVATLAGWLRRHHDRVVGIDHHPRGDAIASARVVDTTAASTTMMLLSLLDELGVEPSGERGGIGEALFVGLATDTGWFRFANADARAFAAAARLLDAGVDKTRLHRIVEEQHRPQRLVLLARALEGLEYYREGVVAVMGLSSEDFRVAGAGPEDVTHLVNVPMVVRSVRVSILLSEHEPGTTKLSLRSKPLQPEERGTTLDRLIDVNRLAARFGGGGHVHAAGARVDANLDETRRRLVETIDETCA